MEASSTTSGTCPFNPRHLVVLCLPASRMRCRDGQALLSTCAWAGPSSSCHVFLQHGEACGKAATPPSTAGFCCPGTCSNCRETSASKCHTQRQTTVQPWLSAIQHHLCCHFNLEATKICRCAHFCEYRAPGALIPALTLSRQERAPGNPKSWQST